jgi:2-iminobutanoate/2-iminopropanoate deaminase
MKKKVISTSNAPAAIGPYSQAIESNGLLFCSGQIPLDPQTGELKGTTIEEQTRQVMHNIQCLLAEAGVSFDRIVKSTCFLADLSDFAAFNKVYAEYFQEAAPARSCVAVAGLPRGAKLEVEVIASV